MSNTVTHSSQNFREINALLLNDTASYFHEIFPNQIVKNAEFYAMRACRAFFSQKFRQINSFTKNSTLNWFDGKNLQKPNSVNFFWFSKLCISVADFSRNTTKNEPLCQHNYTPHPWSSPLPEGALKPHLKSFGGKDFSFCFVLLSFSLNTMKAFVILSEPV